MIRIDGQLATNLPAYVELLASLGPTDEQESNWWLWTVTPEQQATAAQVWLNPSDRSAEQNWLVADGAVLQSIPDGPNKIDRLRQGSLDVSISSSSNLPLALPLAAFLAHGFALVDALVLARAWSRVSTRVSSGHGWPTDLSSFPVPVGGPRSSEPFAECQRKSGLYVVVPDGSWVSYLARHDVPLVQLRDKRADPHIREQAIREAIAAAAHTQTRLYINDDWRLAIQHRAYGVHLGQEDIGHADLDAIRNAGLRLGISTHGYYEMLRAHACRPSYLALGAVYATTTKPMPTSPQGLTRLKRYVELMSPHYPLVAIGGIDLSCAQAVLETGVDSIAVVRAVTEAEDPAAALAKLKAQACAFA